MQHIMIRINTEDYDAWLKVHYEHVKDRQAYGITDGPVYRDVDDPNAALFHIMVDSLPRGLEWFGTETFRNATQRARVTGREFYMAEQRQ